MNLVESEGSDEFDPDESEGSDEVGPDEGSNESNEFG